MRRMIFAMILVVSLGCEEEEGIWISESCREYESEIRWSVNRLNDLEGYEVTWIEGFKKSDPSPPVQKALNDGTDFFYCINYDIDNEYRRGHTNYGKGDVYLYTYNFIDQNIMELLPCTVLHELGHRFLVLYDNENENTIMYKHLTGDCLYKTEWE